MSENGDKVSYILGDVDNLEGEGSKWIKMASERKILVVRKRMNELLLRMEGWRFRIGSFDVELNDRNRYEGLRVQVNCEGEDNSDSMLEGPFFT